MLEIVSAHVVPDCTSLGFMIVSPKTGLALSLSVKELLIKFPTSEPISAVANR